MKYFFQTLPKNILNSFKGKNFWWHLLAWAATTAIVLSGFDWYYFTATRSFTLDAFFFPAVIIGGILPLFGLPIMLLIGWLRKNRLMEMLALAIGQAAAIGWLISSFYKALTGRIPPPQTMVISTDISKWFNFGFFREGINWGWPSSHTVVAFAMVFALITLYPKNKIIKYISIIYAFYIGIGVSLSIHWFSEFVAGAIMGAVIGIVVGKTFRHKINPSAISQ